MKFVLYRTLRYHSGIFLGVGGYFTLWMVFHAPRKSALAGNIYQESGHQTTNQRHALTPVPQTYHEPNRWRWVHFLPTKTVQSDREPGQRTDRPQGWSRVHSCNRVGEAVAGPESTVPPTWWWYTVLAECGPAQLFSSNIGLHLVSSVRASSHTRPVGDLRQRSVIFGCPGRELTLELLLVYDLL